MSDQRGVNEGFCLILLAAENTCQMPLAAIDIPFSTYFIGACMSVLLLTVPHILEVDPGNLPVFQPIGTVRG